MGSSPFNRPPSAAAKSAGGALLVISSASKTLGLLELLSSSTTRPRAKMAVARSSSGSNEPSRSCSMTIWKICALLYHPRARVFWSDNSVRKISIRSGNMREHSVDTVMPPKSLLAAAMRADSSALGRIFRTDMFARTRAVPTSLSAHSPGVKPASRSGIIDPHLRPTALLASFALALIPTMRSAVRLGCFPKISIPATPSRPEAPPTPGVTSRGCPLRLPPIASCAACEDFSVSLFSTTASPLSSHSSRPVISYDPCPPALSVTAPATMRDLGVTGTNIRRAVAARMRATRECTGAPPAVPWPWEPPAAVGVGTSSAVKGYTLPEPRSSFLCLLVVRAENSIRASSATLRSSAAFIC
mmetsp:Transcript_37408/g.117822  ORF Transcript_37408/g.117822 Transcript_37408/m.117822 type:complete len:358 (+) Transcript_37408:1039-2112(+)